MENKLPFTSLVSETFDFGFHRYFAVFRLTILPLLLYIAGLTVMFLVLIDFGTITELAESQTPPPEDFSPFYLPEHYVAVIFSIGGFVLALPLIGANVRIFRLAGLGEEPKFLDAFRFDAVYWKTVLSYILIFLLILAVEFAITAVPGFISLGGTGIINFYMKFILFAAIFCFYIALQIKMIPLHTATACENRIPLIETWQRSHGYFWTIFGGALLLIIMVLGAGYLFLQLIGFLQSIGGVTKALNPAFGVLNALIVVGSLIAGFFFIFFALGVLNGFPAVIYRHLWRD